MPLECEVTILQKKVRDLEFRLTALKGTCDGLVEAVLRLSKTVESNEEQNG